MFRSRSTCSTTSTTFSSSAIRPSTFSSTAASAKSSERKCSNYSDAERGCVTACEKVAFSEEKNVIPSLRDMMHCDQVKIIPDGKDVQSLPDLDVLPPFLSPIYFYPCCLGDMSGKVQFI